MKREPARWNVPHPLGTGTLMSVVPAGAYDDVVAEVVALTEQLQGAVALLRETREYVAADETDLHRRIDAALGGQ